MGDGLGQELDRALWPLTSAPSQAHLSRLTQTVSPAADQASATELRAVTITPEHSQG